MKNTAFLFLILLMASCQKQKGQETPAAAPPDVLTENSKMCFLKVTEGKAQDNHVIRDSIVFSMERKGDSVTGIFNWLPYEKDKKLSTFRGTIQGTTGTAIASYRTEGMEYDEELVFTLENGRVAVKYGEMTEGTDGVWRYKNLDSTSVQVLDKVDCGEQ